MAKSTVAKEVKMVWNMVMAQLSESVVNGHRVAAKDLVVAPIWRFSKKTEGVHLFTHGNREYWVISEKDTEIKTKGKGFFSSQDIEVKVRNFFLVPVLKDHKGRPCYTSYLTNVDTLVKQGIMKECWGDITKSEMTVILGKVVKMLAEAQHVSTDKFKKLAKTLKIGSIKGADKKDKAGKKAGKSTEEMIRETLEKLGESIKEMMKHNQFVAAEAKVEPVVVPEVQPEAKAPEVQPEVKAAAEAPVKAKKPQPARSAKAAAKPTAKPTAETAATQLSNELAAMDLLDGKK
jgi:hypothetical protein